MFLVTGATGFIGSHLVEKLCASGLPVRALVRRIDRDWPCPTARCDLATGQGLEEALDGVDTVIHLAGATKALAPDDYYVANVRAAANLARALAGRAVRLVHVSSLAAAGPSPDGTPVDEDAPPHPVSHYGKSKLEGERVVRELKPDAVIVRPPVVYGPGDTGRVPHSEIDLAGMVRPDRRRRPLVQRDLRARSGGRADPRRRAGTPAAGRTYFLAHPQPNSWASLASAAARIMGVKARPVRVPLPAAYAVGYCAEIWSHMARRAEHRLAR